MRTTNPFILAALMLPMALATSCGKDKVPPGTPKEATKRYETVPYVGTASRADDPKIANLVFSDYDDDYNYYFFVLGHVNSTPLAYRPAIYYNGVTPITVGYSSSNVSEQSISNSVTEAFENSVTQSQSANWGHEVGVTAGIETKFKVPLTSEFTVKLEASYKHSWGTSESTETSTARSFSNTYETSSSKASELRDEISVTIGTNNEPEGLYRFALFSTTDVYFVVITDRAKTEVIEAKIAFCARATQYWELDYDPERGGSFGKTADGALLQIPDLTIDQLPDVIECEHIWGPWVITKAPSGTNDGEEVATCEVCQRTKSQIIPGGTGIYDISTQRWVGGIFNASFENNILIVHDGANFTVTGKVDDGRRIYIGGKSATLTLKDLEISGVSTSLTPLMISASCENLTLMIEGTNILTAGHSWAGIQQAGRGTLTINGPDYLEVIGGYGGAGIGGGRGGDGINFGESGSQALPIGPIIINGGTIIATAGTGAAAIGGGKGGNGVKGKSITNILDLSNPPGVGGNGGGGGATADITINGGTISVKGSSTDIGGGDGGDAGDGGDLHTFNFEGLPWSAGWGGNGGDGGGDRESTLTINGGKLSAKFGLENLMSGSKGGYGGAAGKVVGSHGQPGSSGAWGADAPNGKVVWNIEPPQSGR